MDLQVLCFINVPILITSSGFPSQFYEFIAFCPVWTSNALNYFSKFYFEAYM